MYSTIGVFPLPPQLRFPTLITGTERKRTGVSVRVSSGRESGGFGERLRIETKRLLGRERENGEEQGNSYGLACRRFRSPPSSASPYANSDSATTYCTRF
ncbi:unnamed protein product [Arabidopsis thaliana]|uniref:Uncharacterized protein n=1 Tax=Arabidopsis thaliana TaxID=3702 RepID=Q9LJU9_ARATH|nr:unnamed protein product [Arabidopsis thaliana]